MCDASNNLIAFPDAPRMKREIIPAILAENADEAAERIEQIGSASRWIQFDVADGTLAPNTSWHDARVFHSWKTKSRIELHLMVQNPEAVIKSWRTVPTFKRAIWHIEAPVNHDKLIASCHRAGLECGLALFPETPVAALVPYLRKIDRVLILGVHPGFSGQKLIRATLKKIGELRRLAPRLPVEFDGGITGANAKGLAKRGVSRFAMASAIFQSKNPANFVKSLQTKLNAVH